MACLGVTLDLFLSHVYTATLRLRDWALSDSDPDDALGQCHGPSGSLTDTQMQAALALRAAAGLYSPSPCVPGEWELMTHRYTAPQAPLGDHPTRTGQHKWGCPAR